MEFQNVINTNNNSSNEIITIFPIRNEVLYKYYEDAISCFWVLKDLDYSNDKYEWDNELNENEKYFLTNILSFFAKSDQIVNINLETRFMEDIKTLPKDMIKYTELFYNFQKSMEDIHTQTYEFMLLTYISDDDKREFYMDGIKNISAIKKKAEWGYKWIDDNYSSFMTRLIAFAALEGIFFSSSFCSIYWIKEKNILRGLTKSNEYISRDEGLHRNFACELFNQLKIRDDYNLDTSEGIIYQIIKEAVDIEIEFINESIPCKLIGMNSTEMAQYIKFVADNLLQTIHFEKLYNVDNPFSFMEDMSLENKTNFFESRNTNYEKSDSKKNIMKIEQLIIDDDF
jgi:ribonucleoside-diphosphate reductase subunit M2